MIPAGDKSDPVPWSRVRPYARGSITEEGTAMEPLDKAAIGQRIKSLRKSRGLRQWQMAQFLGATQPAIHKYENGILPEVKRLVELARIGSTSVEWILTGTHWENGSPEMQRMD